MPPILQTFSARQVVSSETSISLDFGLIVGAVIVQYVLSWIPDVKDVLYPWDPIRAFFLIIVSYIAIFVAALLLLAAIVLGWNETISIDALTAVMFPLAGAIGRISYVNKNLEFVCKVTRRPSLCISMDRFRIAKFSSKKPCGGDPNSVTKVNDFNGMCSGPDCKVRMYIRLLPERDSKSFSELLHSFLRRRSPYEVTHSKERAMQSESLEHSQSSSDDGRQQTFEASRGMVEGANVVGHSRNFVVARERRDVTWSWNWQFVSASIPLALDPMKLMLVDQSRALNMFDLVSDILCIGRLVISLRRYYITKLWEKDAEVIKWRTSPGRTSKEILKQLGLHSWFDPAVEGMKSEFRTKAGKRINCQRQQGILFCLLTGKSSVFADKPNSNGLGKLFPGITRRVSGQKILNDIMNAGDKSHGDFVKTCRNRIDDWLVDWGCERSSLVEEDDIRRELEMPETEESKFFAGHPSNDWDSQDHYDSDSESDDSDCECFSECTHGQKLAYTKQPQMQPCFMSLQHFEPESHSAEKMRKREERSTYSGKRLSFPKVYNAALQ